MDADLFADDLPPAQARWYDPVVRAVQGWRAPRWLGSLKVRLALGALLALLLGMAATAWQLSSRAERDLLTQAHLRQNAEVHRLAAILNRHLAGLQEELGTAADQFDTSLNTDPRMAARWLYNQLPLGPRFSNIFLAAPDGRMLAYVDPAGSRFPTTHIGDRPYFKRALQTRAVVISEPVAGRVSGEPVVVLAQPVIRDGQVVAVIGGALRLVSRDLLRDLALSNGTEEPTLLVVTDAQGTVLVHPERGRILRPLTEEPRLAQAFLQWTAMGRPLTSDGGAWSVEGQVVATAGDSLAGWQVWHASPEEALLAPLRQARNLALRDATGLALLLAGVMAAFLAWQFRPLARLERRAAALLAGDATGDWPDASGEIGRLARTLQHVWAERSQMESFNGQVLQKLGSVMAAAPVGLAFTRDQRFELVSSEFCRLLGHDEHLILGQSTQIVFASNEDYVALGPLVGAAFEKHASYSGEWQMIRRDGSTFWGLLRARPVAPGNPAAGTIWSINDITEEVQARRQLQHAAHHDALTGVVNRQGFEQVLQDLFDAQPAARPAALVMIDLDHFKPINDTAGHAAGDAMLVAVAQAIASRVRATDVVVRLGGDEFALLLPRCTHERAVSVAEKVREAITDLALTWEAHTLRVGASLGVCELAEHHESPAQWLAQADAACYEAKRAGRGTVKLARSSLRVVAVGS